MMACSGCGFLSLKTASDSQSLDVYAINVTDVGEYDCHAVVGTELYKMYVNIDTSAHVHANDETIVILLISSQ